MLYTTTLAYMTYMCSSTRTKDQTLRDRMDGWDVWDDKLQRLAPCFGDSLLRLPMAWLIVKMLENHQPKVLKVYYIYIKTKRHQSNSNQPNTSWSLVIWFVLASGLSRLNLGTQEKCSKPSMAADSTSMIGCPSLFVRRVSTNQHPTYRSIVDPETRGLWNEPFTLGEFNITMEKYGI